MYFVLIADLPLISHLADGAAEALVSCQSDHDFLLWTLQVGVSAHCVAGLPGDGRVCPRELHWDQAAASHLI